MKRYLFSVFILLAILVNCKKETLTPDGKPKADAANNTLRISVNSSAQYDFSVSILNSDNTTDVQFTNNKLTKAYEYVHTAVSGQRVFFSVYSDFGSVLTCDVYYKGSRVRLSAMTIEKFDGLPGVPSHIQVNYLIGK